jgi:hypothetical protein
MRKLPYALVATFLTITLARVAEFSGSAMQAGWLGWPFSIGLGVAVFASAYNLRVHLENSAGEESPLSKNVRRWALVALLLFMAADGAFNLWDVLASVTAPELQAAAYVYGLFPTVAAAVLGLLQGALDKLPKPPMSKVERSAANWIAYKLRVPALDAPDTTHTAALPTHDAPARLPDATHEKIYACECGATFVKSTDYASHKRWKCKKEPATL